MPYCSQADVDQAFADLDCYRAAQHEPAPDAFGCAKRCVNCGATALRYDGSASEPGACTCNTCGAVQPGPNLYDYMCGRALTTKSSNYKRIHHWHERISQLLLSESRIPAQHMLVIGERLLNGTHATINKDVIRAVLRSLGLQVYIEKWLQIIQRTTGIAPPVPGPVILQQLDQMFTELQRPFNAHKIQGRRNFLNYNYVFCRLLQRLDCTKFCVFFPLIRSKTKLRVLDDMWRAMSESVGWQFEPLVVVTPFAVRIEEREVLLQKLRSQCAFQASVVPETAPSKTVSRMLGHHSRGPVQRRPPPRPSEPPARTPQTLAVRVNLKRKMLVAPPRSQRPKRCQPPCLSPTSAPRATPSSPTMSLEH